MRILLFALALLGVGLSTTAASAQHFNFAPIISGLIRPMMQHQQQRPVLIQQRPVRQGPFRGTGSLPDGCNPSDLYNGGMCGGMAASWCNTDVMLHLRLRQDCYGPSVNNGALNGGYGGQARGYGGYGGRGQQMQSTQTTVTTTWHTHEAGRQFSGGQFPPGMANLPMESAPQHQATGPVDNAPSWLHIQRE
jgi:hypothetical protein